MGKSETPGEAIATKSSAAKHRVMLFTTLGTEDKETSWYIVDVEGSSSSKSTDDDDGKKKKNNDNWTRKRSHEESKDDDEEVEFIEKDEGVEFLRPVRNSKTRYHSGYCRIGSTIYRVGGDYTDEVLQSNIKDDYFSDWKDVIPKMIMKRDEPEVIAVDGKIYAFGGRGAALLFSPWAEVYDTKKREKKWTPLADPPVLLEHGDLFAVHDPDPSSLFKGQKIILGSCSSLSLLAYDVESESWDIIAENFEMVIRANRPVLHNDSLYWICNGVAVYNLHLQEMFSGPIVGDFDNTLLFYSEYVSYRPMVFHSDGNEFCCVWKDHVREDDGNVRSTICCTTIEISNRRSKKTGLLQSVKGRSLFTQRFPVSHWIGFLEGVLLQVQFQSELV